MIGSGNFGDVHRQGVVGYRGVKRKEQKGGKKIRETYLSDEEEGYCTGQERRRVFHQREKVGLRGSGQHQDGQGNHIEVAPTLKGKL